MFGRDNANATVNDVLLFFTAEWYTSRCYRQRQNRAHARFRSSGVVIAHLYLIAQSVYQSIVRVGLCQKHLYTVSEQYVRLLQTGNSEKLWEDS